MEHEEATPTCPAAPRFQGDVTGCGSSNVSEPDAEGFRDCGDCGLFFKDGAAKAAPAADSPQQDSHLLDLVDAARQAQAFIKTLLDDTGDEAIDLLENYGENVESRLHFALVHFQPSGRITFCYSHPDGDVYDVMQTTADTNAILTGMRAAGYCDFDPQQLANGSANITVPTAMRARFEADFNAKFYRHPPKGDLPLIFPSST